MRETEGEGEGEIKRKERRGERSRKKKKEMHSSRVVFSSSFFKCTLKKKVSQVSSLINYSILSEGSACVGVRKGREGKGVTSGEEEEGRMLLVSPSHYLPS